VDFSTSGREYGLVILDFLMVWGDHIIVCPCMTASHQLGEVYCA
jgi:hypothetical protein